MMTSRSLLRATLLLLTGVSLTLATGCAKKALPPVEVSMELDDNIFEPGETVYVTMTVTNPAKKARRVALPAPGNTRVWQSIFANEGENAVAKGKLGLSAGSEDTGAVEIGPGASVQSTLVIDSLGEEAGRYLLVGTYKNGAEPGAKARYSNQIEIFVE